MKNTQKTKVKRVLLERGTITRNECLENSITRLSSIIHNLKDKGMDITGKATKTDFVYTLNKDQMSKHQSVEIINGTARVTYN